MSMLVCYHLVYAYVRALYAIVSSFPPGSVDRINIINLLAIICIYFIARNLHRKGFSSYK